MTSMVFRSIQFGRNCRRGIALGLVGIVVVLSLVACVGSRPVTHQGLVEDPKTGLLFGSVIEKNILSDPTFYKNPKIKVRIRNTSGDTAFELKRFTGKIRDAFEATGYETTTANDFGILVDVNVMYSGQIQLSLSEEFAFIGGAAGAVGGAKAGSGTTDIAVGAISGATIGGILGSFVTQDTYIIVSRATFAVIKDLKKSKKTVTFSRSAKLKNVDDPDEEEKVILKRFKRRVTTGIAVYAGGTSVSQTEIAGEVRQRLVRIIGDFI